MRDLAKEEKGPVRHAGGDLSGDWIVGSFRMRFGHVDSTVLATADNSRGSIHGYSHGNLGQPGAHRFVPTHHSIVEMSTKVLLGNARFKKWIVSLELRIRPDRTGGGHRFVSSDC